MRIEISDTSSNLGVVYAEISIQEFMRALTGSIERECMYMCYTNNKDKWGKILETKKETMPMPEDTTNKDKVLELVVKDYRKKYGHGNKWRIHHSGIGAKQSGDKWIYTVGRYIEDNSTIILKESEGN